MSNNANGNYGQANGNNVAGSQPLGGYLVEAGLITPAQIEVVLNDQRATGMRFGEILAARGWVKEQTVEYLMRKVVIPERQEAAKRTTQPGVNPRNSATSRDTWIQDETVWQPPVKPTAPRRTERKLTWGAHPISQPPPPDDDDDVQWVG